MHSTIVVVALVLCLSASAVFATFEIGFNCDDKKGYDGSRNDRVCERYATPSALIMFASLGCGILLMLVGLAVSETTSKGR